MRPLKFIYQDAKGEVKQWTLVRWSENTLYLQGRAEDDTLPRTFRKDRVLDYLEGHDQLLFELAPPAPEPAPRAEPDRRPQILFTGFKSADRQGLEEKAISHGFRVMKTAGKALAVLCIGYNAGPKKVEAAREAGAFIVTEDQLERLLLTGEVPC